MTPARSLALVLTWQITDSAGPPPESSPGWAAAVPAAIFLVLAAVAWSVWRYLAREDE